MPKMKTYKAASKRFKVTGSGKIVRRQRNKGHILTKKSSARKRRVSGVVEITPPLVKAVERLLGVRSKGTKRQAAARELAQGAKE